jgi:coenzyme Q-binding protein COQ10
MPFAPDAMMALVADVQAYPRFLPWVKAARLWGPRGTKDRAHDFSAEVIVGYKAFRARFSTTVDVDFEAGEIRTRLIQGPFRALDCVWRFKTSASGCLIDVTIDFEFAERVLQGLLEANMDKAVTRLMEAFTAEAERRYGPLSSTGAA